MVSDFDGVMTDNNVYVDQNGNKMVQVSRADGLGIAEIRKLGIQQMILSTEKIDNKAQALTDYCENHHPGLGDAISGSVMIDVEPHQVHLEKNTVYQLVTKR